jgi:hypothetical protein
MAQAGAMTGYQLKNGATIGDYLTAVSTAWTFESTERGFDLLTAMREILIGIERISTGPAYVADVYPIENLESSFLELFRLWLGVTGNKVPALVEPTMEDAFTVLFSSGEAEHGI